LYVEDEFGGTVIYQYNLASASNTSITGVTGSGTSKNWEAGFDWAHIVVVYNGGLSQSARSQVYWNGSQLTLTSTTSTATLSGNIATTNSSLLINSGIDAVINVFNGQYLMDDMTWYYQTALTLTNAFNIYNGGLPTDYTSLSSISTSLYHYNFENAANLGEEYVASFNLNNFSVTQSTDVP
jgi:homospermidine synthase